MDNIEYVKERLKKLDEKDIIFTKHAEERLVSRDIKKEEVIGNLSRPDKLIFAERQESEDPSEKKFDCYFRYTEDYHHRYVIALDKKCIIITIMDRHRSLEFSERKKNEIQL